MSQRVRLTVTSGRVSLIEKAKMPSRRQQFHGEMGPIYVQAHPAATEDRLVVSAAYNTDVSTWLDGVYDCKAVGPDGDLSKWRCLRIKPAGAALSREIAAPSALEAGSVEASDKPVSTP